MKTQKLPAGRYFIGDPCYCFDNDPIHGSWRNILGETDYFESYSEKYPGLIASSTSYGDGTYFDKEMNRYSVDAGLIGAIHEKYWETSEKRLQALGRIVVFNEEFVFASKFGVFQIGDSIYIDTSFFNEDEYEDE